MMNPLEKAHLMALSPLTMLIDMEEVLAASVVVIRNYPTETISEANLLNLLSIIVSEAVAQVEIVPVFIRVTSLHPSIIFCPQLAMVSI